MTRRSIRLLAALCCVVFAAGCANIPDESVPEVITPQQLGQLIKPEVQEPAKDLDGLTVVRDFVHASAQPIANNASARMYLDETARKTWDPAQGLTVIDETFGTVYGTGGQQPPDPNEQLVILRGFQVGTLGSDSAFIPRRDSYELPFRLRRQPDGQWRIVNPPTNLVITESDFSTNYFRVPVYFFTPDSSALVPDLRYVAAKPQSGLPARVVQLLLDGPSDGLSGAVKNPLPDQAGTEQNVTGGKDGALVVPLTGVGEQSLDTKKLIAHQFVLSLQSVTTSRVRLLSDGSALVPGHEDWLPSDVPSYGAQATPSSGMMVVGGRVRSLLDGTPVPGPAGAGVYDVASAAQSMDGRQLAVVENADGRQLLRAGDLSRSELPRVSNGGSDLGGSTLTRPTWRPASSAGGTSGELWTVLDGSQVIRVPRTADGKWVPQIVNASDVVALGPISALRLSRDGARAAMVVGQQLVVASVVRAPGQDSVTLKQPRILRGGELIGVVDVDWLSQDTLVVATWSQSLPVARVPIDGLRMDAFNSSNLTPPMRAITAAPGRQIVVADSGGMWTASDIGEVWRPHPRSIGDKQYPFYPG
ncbi:LpqB family beta-propeller domain-containing protein [Amycolatopsis anabasis]|uniref:LpqB family beta-propeller domain-containing protein n=1 Tax=Amycolatopsis anabasis TaxID=1840409 RepID=UPI00131B2EA5|nr:LpqB family beta-propeller domain-containing protein [Amycolatopsis anabasis]